jgi:hypothetical protein
MQSLVIHKLKSKTKKAEKMETPKAEVLEALCYKLEGRGFEYRGG